MPSEAIQTSARGHGDAIRDAALVAGVRVEFLLRAPKFRGMPRPLLIGAGLLTGGVVVALAKLAGADLRGITAGQPGLLAGLLPGSSNSS